MHARGSSWRARTSFPSVRRTLAPQRCQRTTDARQSIDSSSPRWRRVSSSPPNVRRRPLSCLLPALFDFPLTKIRSRTPQISIAWRLSIRTAVVGPSHLSHRLPNQRAEKIIVDQLQLSRLSESPAPDRAGRGDRSTGQMGGAGHSGLPFGAHARSDIDPPRDIVAPRHLARLSWTLAAFWSTHSTPIDRSVDPTANDTRPFPEPIHSTTRTPPSIHT